jgi:hypothetical protein
VPPHPSHQKTIKNHQNDKKKIEETSKYKNKKLSKFIRRKENIPPPLMRNFTQFFLKNHKMNKKKN